MAKELFTRMNFAADTEDNNDTRVIIDTLKELAAFAVQKEYKGLIEPVTIEDYSGKNKLVKETILQKASKLAGITVVPNDATSMAIANDNLVFRSYINAVQTQALSAMLATYDVPWLSAFCEITTVPFGGTKSFTLEPKALPVAQRGTYASNLSLVPGYANSSVNITPKAYTMGVSLDYSRLADATYDWGKAVAKVYAGMIYAQCKLAASKVFNETILSSTPFYLPTFTLSTYVGMVDDIAMLNGSTADDMIALGTKYALNTISGTATSGGFMTKDEYIVDGYIKQVAGVNSVQINNFTNYSAAFTSATAVSLRGIPRDLIVVVSAGKDKPVKLVREDYIRVSETPAQDNTLNRNEYTYNFYFDADIATTSWFGVQKAA